MKNNHKANATIISSLLILVTSQLNINIIINGFTISMSLIFLPLFSFLINDFSPFKTCALAAPFVLSSRCLLSYANGDMLTEALVKFSPEIVFFIVYGMLFSLYLKSVKFDRIEIKFFIPIIIIDFISNISELYLRLGEKIFNENVIFRIFIIAFGRTFIAMIIVLAFNYYGNFILKKEEQLRYQNLLLLISNLKSEIIFMNKNAHNIENITKDAYDIYEHISSDGNIEYSQKSLELAKNIHEIKKEYMLIMRGINEVLDNEKSSDYMEIKYIFAILEKSLLLMDKNVDFDITTNYNFNTNKHYLLLSIFRNIITNSIEANKSNDNLFIVNIKIRIYKKDDDIIFTIEDNCGGIEEKYRDKIFNVGFSTKINYENGTTGRGLGLAIVNDIVKNKLDGDIFVENLNNGTLFKIIIPKSSIQIDI